MRGLVGRAWVRPCCHCCLGFEVGHNPPGLCFVRASRGRSHTRACAWFGLVDMVTCKACGQLFRGAKGLQWHRKHFHGPQPVQPIQLGGEARQGAVVMVPVDAALLLVAMRVTTLEWGWPQTEPGRWLEIYLHRSMRAQGFDIAPHLDSVDEDGGDDAA